MAVQIELICLYDIKIFLLLQIPKAQPSQYNGPVPASFNGGRSSTSFYDKELPNGLFVCGDHMATATLNGAIESGVNAGIDVAAMAASIPSAATAK